MRIDAGFGDLRELLDGYEGDIAKAATDAMQETTYKAVRELRRQITSNGLGQRLANTWRDRVYPKQRRSVNPTGYIWSNAPDIFDSFNRGATIHPLAGRRFLAIPTENVPRAGGRRGSTRRMTPVEVQGAFDQELFFKRGKSGRVLAFVDVLASRSGRGFRKGTKGRLAQGRALRPVLMFVLGPTAQMPKLLDIEGVADRWSQNFVARFTARLEQL